MQIEFKAEDIEKYVKEAVIKSSVGKAIDDAIKDVMRVDRYDSPIKKHLEMIVRDIAADIIREKFSADIRQKVATLIETLVNEEMLENLTNTAVNKMVRAMENRDY